MEAYRRKPDLFEAVQLTAENVDEVSAWCGGTKVQEVDGTVALDIPTLQSVLTGKSPWVAQRRAKEGDYVVKESEGVFTPLDAETFLATYE